jgi:hypothetical protein
MNRRDFFSRAVLGGVAACTAIGNPSLAAAAPGSVNLRFIGMMGFVERRDRSFLVATPGETHHHLLHVPFLMARAGSPIAKAFGLAPAAGVIPEAFDTELVGTRAGDFVYRSLANTSIEVVSGTTDAVRNEATQMAQLQDIAPGKRVRGNLEKWAGSTVSLRGGRLLNSSAHPDAGKMWSFGSYQQRLTDAVNYRNLDGAATTLRLTSATEAITVTIAAGDTAELWVISSAEATFRLNDPMKLVHSQLLFDYLVDAPAIPAECPDATGREVPATALPFVKPTSASAGLIASEATAPPLTDLCFIAAILFGGGK